MNKNRELLRIIFLPLSYLFYILLILVVTDRIYARYEKLPFHSTKIILQGWRPDAFQDSAIPGLIYEMKANLKFKDRYVETNSLGIRADE